jgi:hypothetical protein
MADINQVISLGIGEPASIPHFILLGLSPTGEVGPPDGLEVVATYRDAVDVSATYRDAVNVTATSRSD